MKRFFCFLCSIIILIVVLPVFAYTSPGMPTGFVNDFAGMVSAETRGALESEIRTFQEKTTHEISVVTISSLDGDYIENYAEKLFQEWGIGKKGADNGVLLLISRDDKKMRIEVGYGLEGALTDAESSQIIRNVLRPAFQQGDFDGGIAQAVLEIERAIQEEVPIQASSRSSGVSSGLMEFFVWIGILLFFWLSSVLARTKSWWLGGVIGGGAGLIVGIILFSIWFGAVFFVVWGTVGLFVDYIVSKNYQRNKALGRRASWWAGGGWGPGGRGGGGGGFGGFGGGGSGGGGSSGGW